MNTGDSTSQGPRANLIDGWTDLWNGDLAAAERIASRSISVCFGGQAIGPDGDRIRTPEELARLVGAFRATRPGLVYRVVEARTTAEWGFCVWNAAMGDLHVGGIDTFTFAEDGITRVWSVTGQRPLGA